MAIGKIQNQNDSPIGTTDYRPPVKNGIVPVDGQILSWSASEQAYLAIDGVQTNSFIITNDAGNGSVEDDCNNTDFTGQSPVVGTAASIPQASITTFVHKTVAYNWTGPTGVTVGLGGSYVVTASDFQGVGTADHAILVNLTDPDSHPTSAITGLDADQATQDADIASNLAAIQSNDADISALDVRVTQNTDDISSNDTDIGALGVRMTAAELDIDQNTANISSNDTDIATNASDIATNAQNLVDHETAPDPHPQYALETAVLANFVSVGYGSIGDDSASLLPNITSTFQDYNTWDTIVIANPFNVTNSLPNGMRLDAEGVWQVNIKISLSHAASNDGRVIQARFKNFTTAEVGTSIFNFGVGRNTEVSNIFINTLFEVGSDGIGQIYGLQLGTSGDTFSSVIVLGSYYSVSHVSEYKGSI